MADKGQMIGLKWEAGGRNIVNSLFGSYRREERKKEGSCDIEKSFNFLNGLENKYIQTTCGFNILR
jgi:hypothetical protein